PFPVGTYTLPAESAAGPVSAAQTPPSLPSGVTFSTACCANVAASYAITQPWYGGTSQDDAQARKTEPSKSSSDARGFSRSGSKATCPFTAPAPRPETAPVISFGPPNFSAPVVIANAWRR